MAARIGCSSHPPSFIGTVMRHFPMKTELSGHMFIVLPFRAAETESDLNFFCASGY